MARVSGTVETVNARTTLQDLMKKTLVDQQTYNSWIYDAIRPMPVPRVYVRGNHVRGDCSKGCQYLCRWANAPDPMKNNWSDWGNSTTICLSLRHLANPSLLEIGDIVTFGTNGDEHAAMIYAPGSDPLLWSFGHQGAPNTYRLSQDGRVHQLLKLPVVYVETKEDQLRAQTGWFAWAAWYLGEGDWKSYGPRNPKVRPDVPVKIPQTWWDRLTKFLAARQSGNPATTAP